MVKNKKIKLLIALILSSLASIAQCDSDTINPWFVDFQYELTVSCSDYVNTAMPQVDDNCSGDIEMMVIEEIVPGTCEGEQTVYRLYRVFDSSGNQVVEMQTIHVVDETAPVFSKLSDQNVVCGAPILFDEPSVFDNCSAVFLSSIDVTESIDECTTSYIRVWTAQDDCNNTSTVQQTITVMDVEPPTIVGDVYVELEQGMSVDESYVVALDNCSEVSVTYTDVDVSGPSIIRTYTAVDACGNQSTFEQIIHTENNNQVAICHGLGNGNWITIYVAPQAVPAHLAHGDYLGPCRTDSNQWLPYMNLERLPDGSIRKIVRTSK